MELTEQKIKDRLEIEKEKCRLNDDDWNTFHERNVKRLNALLEFVRSDVRFKYELSDVIMYGTVVVEDKFVFALISNKWKVIGKNVWYRSRGPSDFIKRFVKEK
jgi:hypothetical protein